MPWTNQGGNGGGPWGSGGNDQNPWGGPPGRGPGGNSGGPTVPSFEDMIRRGQDRLRQALPGGGGSGNKQARHGRVPGITVAVIPVAATQAP